MKFLVLLSVLLIVSQSILAKKLKAENLFLLVTQNGNCEKQGLQCKDCESIQYCTEDLKSIFSVKCAAQNRLKPYCNSTTHSCTDLKPNVCNVGDPSFMCPGVGYYPDPEDCAKYYMCDNQKLASHLSCEAGNIYDHPLQSCKPGFFCKSYSAAGYCKNKVNKLITYASSKNLYVLCLTTRPSILFQCPQGEVFVETEVTCKFECPGNGFYPNTNDVTKFISCIKIGNNYIQTELECMSGTEFIVTENGKGICGIKIETTEAVPNETEFGDESTHIENENTDEVDVTTSETLQNDEKLVESTENVEEIVSNTESITEEKLDANQVTETVTTTETTEIKENVIDQLENTDAEIEDNTKVTTTEKVKIEESIVEPIENAGDIIEKTETITTEKLETEKEEMEEISNNIEITTTEKDNIEENVVESITNDNKLVQNVDETSTTEIPNETILEETVLVDEIIIAENNNNELSTPNKNNIHKQNFTGNVINSNKTHGYPHKPSYENDIQKGNKSHLIPNERDNIEEILVSIDENINNEVHTKNNIDFIGNESGNTDETQNIDI